MVLNVQHTNTVFSTYFHEKEAQKKVFLYAKEQKKGSYQLEIGRGYGHFFFYWIGKIANKLFRRVDQKRVLLQEAGRHFSKLDPSLSQKLSQYFKAKKITIYSEQQQQGKENSSPLPSFSQDSPSVPEKNPPAQDKVKEEEDKPILPKDKTNKKKTQETPRSVGKEEISEHFERIQKWKNELEKFDPKGFFGEELWQLAGGEKVGAGQNVCQSPRNEDLLKNLSKYREDLNAWIQRIQGIQKENSSNLLDRSGDVQEALGDMETSCKLLAEELRDKGFILEEEKDAYRKNYLLVDKEGTIDVYKNLEMKLRNAELKYFKQWFNTMIRFAFDVGNCDEYGKTLRDGIEKLRQYKAHRKPDTAPCGEMGTAEAVFQFCVREYFGCDSAEALKPFDQISVTDAEQRDENWMPIASVRHVHGNHFVISVANGEEEACVDNMHPLERNENFQGTVNPSISIDRALYEKLGREGAFFSIDQLCVPRWNANNCYLSSAFLAFAVLIRFGEKAEIFNPETV